MALEACVATDTVPDFCGDEAETASVYMVAEIAEDEVEYKKFYESFLNNIKLGVHTDSTICAKLAKLLCYHSAKSGNDMPSLERCWACDACAAARKPPATQAGKSSR